MQHSPRALISQAPVSELGRQCDLIEISGTLGLPKRRPRTFGIWKNKPCSGIV